MLAFISRSAYPWFQVIMTERNDSMKPKVEKSIKILAFVFAMMVIFMVRTDSEAATRLQGKGTHENPYKITSAADLMTFRDLVNSSPKGSCSTLCAELTDNIVIEDIAVSSINDNIEPELINSKGNKVDKNSVKQWEPIGYYNSAGDCVFYSGEFNGNGFAIDGIYINDKKKCQVGLFGSTSRAIISNLTVGNAFIKGDTFVGGIVGSANATLLQNCRFDDYSYYDNMSFVIGTSGVAGGVCGVMSDLVTDETGTQQKGYFKKTARINLLHQCVNYGTISGNFYVGGICGLNYYAGNENCMNFGNVYCENTDYAGEICGYTFTSGEVAPNDNKTGDATAEAEQVGEVAGEAAAETKEAASGDTEAVISSIDENEMTGAYMSKPDGGNDNREAVADKSSKVIENEGYEDLRGSGDSKNPSTSGSIFSSGNTLLFTIIGIVAGLVAGILIGLFFRKKSTVK